MAWKQHKSGLKVNCSRREAAGFCSMYINSDNKLFGYKPTSKNPIFVKYVKLPGWPRGAQKLNLWPA